MVEENVQFAARARRRARRGRRVHRRTSLEEHQHHLHAVRRRLLREVVELLESEEDELLSCFRFFLKNTINKWARPQGFGIVTFLMLLKLIPPLPSNKNHRQLA